MSSTPSRPEPTNDASPNPASQRDEDAQYYRQVLHELIEIGTDLARIVHRQATPEAQQRSQPRHPAPDPTIAFDRIARTLRRTIALARKLTDPAPPSPAERRAPSAASQPASRSSARSRTPSSAGPTAPRRRRCTPSFASAWTTPTSTTTSTSSPSPTSSPRSAATSASSTSPAPIPGSAARPRTCATSAPAQQGPRTHSPGPATRARSMHRPRAPRPAPARQDPDPAPRPRFGP